MAFIYSLTDSWTDALVTWNGIKLAVTNTGSSSTSNLLNLTISGSTTGSFVVDKNANLSLTGSITLSGTGSSTLSAPSSAGTFNFRFPSANGTNGFVLSTDGSGNTSWVSPGNASITVGTSSVLNGFNGAVLFDNGGLLGADSFFSWNNSTKTLSSRITNTVLSQPTNATFFSSTPYAITQNSLNGLGGRLFVGAAIVNSGDFIFGPSPYTGATTKDWLDTFEGARTSPPGYRTTMSQLASLSTNGGVAVLGGSRTSDMNVAAFNGAQFANAVTGEVINDNTTYPQHAAGMYGVGFQLPGVKAAAISQAIPGIGTIGAEFDVVNEDSTAPQIVPGNLYPSGFTTGLQVNSGAAVQNFTIYPASAAFTIGNNLQTFLSGIVIGQTAIEGTTGSSGAASAIRMGNYHQVEWWQNAGSAPSFLISSQMATPANAQAIISKDTGLWFGNGAGTLPQLEVLYVGASASGNIQISPAYSTTPNLISTAGSSTALSVGTGGAAALTFFTNGSSNVRVTIPSTGGLQINGSTSGGVTLASPSAPTSYTITLPSAVAGGNGYILTSTTGGVTSWSNPTALGIDLDVGTTVITGGTTGRVLYNNAGVLDEYSVIPLANGGTNANLTASNGGIFYSTASAAAILSGTATAGQMLRSGASGAPSWSTATFPSTATTTGTILRADGTNWVATTATYPATTTINRILYSSANNTISEISTTNGGVLNANSSGVPSITVTPTLGVAGTSAGTIGLSGVTSGVVTVQTAAAAGTWSLTLPTSGGTNNYVLTTNGSGTSSWSQVSLTAGVTGVLPVANGGTNASSAGITAFNNITGYTATGATGTTSTDLVFSTSPTITTPTISGNETYTGTAGRIIADFDNATVNSRRAFQTSTTNASTGIYALPNGSSTAASWQASNAADPTNASKILIATNGSTDVQLVSGINGTGTYLPLSFYTNGSQSMQLDTSANLTVNGTVNMGSSFLRNRLINGSMAVDQRNLGAAQTFTAAAALAYSVDRWYGYCTGANVTGQRIAGTAPAQYAYRFTGATSNTAVGFGQRIEQLNSYYLASSAVTISAFMTASTNTTITWYLYTPTTTADTFGTLASPTVTQIATGTFAVTSSRTRFTATIAAATMSGNNKGLELRFVAASGLGNTVTWTVEDVQLEAGTIATSVERRQYGEEYMLCQRYLPAVNTDGATGFMVGNGFYATTTVARIMIPFQVPTRTRATGVTVTNATNFTINGDANSIVSSAAFNGGSNINGNVDFTIPSTSINAGNGCQAFGNASGTAQLLFTGCEL